MSTTIFSSAIFFIDFVPKSSHSSFRNRKLTRSQRQRPFVQHPFLDPTVEKDECCLPRSSGHLIIHWCLGHHFQESDEGLYGGQPSFPNSCFSANLSIRTPSAYIYIYMEYLSTPEYSEYIKIRVMMRSTGSCGGSQF
jgi:hypothetical protein